MMNFIMDENPCVVVDERC